MIPLLAQDAVPYGQVATIVGALVAAVLALGAIIVALWRHIVNLNTAALAREKEIGALARSDGEELAKAIVTTNATLAAAVSKMEQSDDQRAAIGDDIRSEIKALGEKLDDVGDAIQKCSR